MKHPSLLKIMKSVQALLERAQDPAASDLIGDLVAVRLIEVVNLMDGIDAAVKRAGRPQVEPVADPSPKSKAPRRKKPHRMSEAEKTRARELLAAGHTLNKVASFLGRSISGVRYAVVEKRAPKS